MEFANDVGYPVLVRPSYVLSGAAMNVAWNDEQLHACLRWVSSGMRNGVEAGQEASERCQTYRSSSSGRIAGWVPMRARLAASNGRLPSTTPKRAVPTPAQPCPPRHPSGLKTAAPPVPSRRVAARRPVHAIFGRCIAQLRRDSRRRRPRSRTRPFLARSGEPAAAEEPF